MDIIKMARELGKAIQQDELYLNMQKANETAEKAQDLQKKLGDFANLRAELNQEIMKAEGEKDTDKIADLDNRLRALYEAITEAPEMLEYNKAKAQLEETLNFISQIVTGAANGQNPDTIEKQSSCSGSCSGCSGCH